MKHRCSGHQDITPHPDSLDPVLRDMIAFEELGAEDQRITHELIYARQHGSQWKHVPPQEYEAEPDEAELRAAEAAALKAQGPKLSRAARRSAKAAERVEAINGVPDEVWDAIQAGRIQRKG